MRSHYSQTIQNFIKFNAYKVFEYAQAIDMQAIDLLVRHFEIKYQIF